MEASAFPVTEYEIVCTDTQIVTITELVQKYLESAKETMKPSAYALYESYALNEVIPKIGGMPAKEFDRKRLEDFLERCLSSRDGKQRSRNTMYAIEAVVRAVFHYGVQTGLIPAVSLGKIKYTRQYTENDVSILSRWEIKGLLHDAQELGPAQTLQVMLPLYLGLSLSELSGLKWEDIDFKDKSIYVHRCLKRITQKEADGTAVSANITYELSSYEQRTFRIPETIYAMLKEVFYGEWEFGSVQIPKQNQSWFVASLNYKYIEGRTLQYRLKNLGIRGGMENLSYRCLRDTFAVTSLRAGANARTLATILGVKMQVVCDRYQEWMKYDDRFLDRLE